MKVWKVAVPFLALVWIGLRGVPSLFEFGLGLVVGFISIAPFRQVYGYELSLTRMPGIVFWFTVYVAVFIYEIVKANMMLAYIVIHPGLPIDPKVFWVSLNMETELGVALIANSITLTPGTLTMDYDEEQHALRIHAVAGDEETILEPVNRLQSIARRIGV